MDLFSYKRFPLLAVCLAVVIVAAAEREASAGVVLLAQSGSAKTAIGYALTLLAILLGMVVVLRPNKRKLNEKKKHPVGK